MNVSDIKLSGTESYDALIEQYINVDPVEVALKTRNSELASHIKYLQRAKHKLPSWYAARCIISKQLFEQSSSQAVADAKFSGLSGERALDLTCGLGVDSSVLSAHFKEVTSIEIDADKVTTASYNFKRLGISNISIENCSAEEFCASAEKSPIKYDFVYLDPSRIKDGQRVFSIEDCSPNFNAILPALLKIASRIVVKLSPLFDIEELYRLYSSYHIDIAVISSGNECKELLLGITPSLASNVGNVAVNHIIIDSNGVRSCVLSKSQKQLKLSDANLQLYSHLVIPNVAFYKSRLLNEYIDYAGIDGDFFNYIFTRSKPVESIEGQLFKIDRWMLYNSKNLRTTLKEMKIKSAQILIKDFPHTLEELRKTLKLKAGNDARLIFTTIKGQLTVFFVTL